MPRAKGDEVERNHIGVLVDAELHRRARVFAIEDGQTLAELVEAALRRYVRYREVRARKAKKARK